MQSTQQNIIKTSFLAPMRADTSSKVPALVHQVPDLDMSFIQCGQFLKTRTEVEIFFLFL